jgi:hypothetical protein
MPPSETAAKCEHLNLETRCLDCKAPLGVYFNGLYFPSEGCCEHGLDNSPKVAGERREESRGAQAPQSRASSSGGGKA